MCVSVLLYTSVCIILCVYGVYVLYCVHRVCLLYCGTECVCVCPRVCVATSVRAGVDAFCGECPHVIGIICSGYISWLAL